MKKLLMVLFAALLAMSMALAQDHVEIEEIKINGDVVADEDTVEITDIDRDQEITVTIKVAANEDVDDAQIEAVIRGYDYSETIDDITEVFDMSEGRTYRKTLKLHLPYRLDREIYKLRIRVDTQNLPTVTRELDLEINSDRYDVLIRDVSFSPSNEVMAGRAFLSTIRLKNIGYRDLEDGAKVAIHIPELGISAVDYIDDIDEDDSVTSEELYLRIPSDAQPGVYKAVVSIEYRQGDRLEEVEKVIRVLPSADSTQRPSQPGPDAPAKTVISVGPTAQDVGAGQGGVIYPLTISNSGDVAKTYLVSTQGFESWGNVRVSPSNAVVLQPYEAKALYLYVSANADAAPGEKVFAVSVSSGGESLKEFTLQANVLAGENKGGDSAAAGNWGSVKKGLEIGLVVLVVLLVILALIIGFSKLRGGDNDFDEDNDDNQNYY